jgi:multicomponent Na+:H+ antiporter subunit D
MVELGLLAVARVYWTVFEGPLSPHADGVRLLLVWLGLATAVLGAVMCMLERHLKRLLAYSTISHAGAMLAGIGLLNAVSLGGVENLVLSHAFLKGALFLGTGVLLRQFASVDELALHGKGRSLPVLGALFGLAAFGLIGVPYVGTFLGHSLLDEGAIQHGHGWIPPVIMVAAGVSSGAILRSWARVFLGWGPKEDPLLTPEPSEEPPEEEANLPVMVGVTGAMVLIGLALSLAPGLQDRTEHAADRFRDRAAYVQRTLGGHERTYGPPAPVVLHPAKPSSIGYGIGAALVALLAAAFGLFRGRLPGAVLSAGKRVLAPAVVGLKSVHSGIPGDYVMWMTVGAGLLGGIWALAFHA